MWNFMSLTEGVDMEKYNIPKVAYTSSEMYG